MIQDGKSINFDSITPELDALDQTEVVATETEMTQNKIIYSAELTNHMNRAAYFETNKVQIKVKVNQRMKRKWQHVMYVATRTICPTNVQTDCYQRFKSSIPPQGKLRSRLVQISANLLEAAEVDPTPEPVDFVIHVENPNSNQSASIAISPSMDICGATALSTPTDTPNDNNLDQLKLSSENNLD
ncbi:unnamed protein product [Cylindrotheca closterium]|uniref:Uncharacterized protein n=1 Tax=Cylindrotheca closterium TaxID=2856 RepID=A0AAD2CH36_9STRA|nr:unnamed protein product [Cylindrotheca closterium]